MIFWIASYPRSGNSLLRMSLTRFCGIRTATAFDERSYEGLPVTAADPRSAEQLRELRATVPVKTHHLDHAADPAPAVYLIRDGRDSVVSYAHFLLRGEDETGQDALEETMARIVEGELGFGAWSAHVETWTAREAPTYLVRFEDLLADPVAVSRRAAAEMGLGLPPLNGIARQPSFEDERRDRPRLVRRGITGSWRSEMPGEIERRFWELHGETMLAWGYERDL